MLTAVAGAVVAAEVEGLVGDSTDAGGAEPGAGAMRTAGGVAGPWAG